MFILIVGDLIIFLSCLMVLYKYDIKQNTAINKIDKFLHWQYIMLFSGKQKYHLMNIVQEIPAHHFSFCTSGQSLVPVG